MIIVIHSRYMFIQMKRKNAILQYVINSKKKKRHKIDIKS